MSELVRGGRVILNAIQAITLDAQRLANELAGFAAAQSGNAVRTQQKGPLQ
jgi:hypothetical protein